MSKYHILQLKVFIPICMFCICSSVISFAQFNTAKVDALSALAGRVGLGYERTLNNSVSIQLGFEYGSLADATFNGQKYYDLIGLTIEPEIRFYPFRRNRDAPYGFFIGELFRYTKYTEHYLDVFHTGRYAGEAHSKVLSFDLEAGYKVRYKRFSMEAVLGYGLINELHFDDKREYIANYILFVDLLEPQNGFTDENGFLRLKILVGYTFCKKGRYYMKS